MAMLHIPPIARNAAPRDAALAYAQAGWYVIPVDREGTGKNPGSILGGDWPRKSSRDPDQIQEWFSSAFPERNIALHVGRSGAVAFDHDQMELPAVLTEAIEKFGAPYQTTPSGGGHYLFRQPPGRSIGNSTGKLGSDWGEVRGQNGVIVVAPSVLVDKDEPYCWHPPAEQAQSGGWSVPTLPDSVSSLLPDAGIRDRTATQVERSEFLDRYGDSSKPEMLSAVIDYYKKKAHAGSRHETLTHCACWAMREARMGFYSARTAHDRLWQEFEQTAGKDRYIESEFAGVMDWAIGQIRALSDQQLQQATLAAEQTVVDEEIQELEDKLLDTFGLDSLPDPRWLIAGWLEQDSIARMVGKSRHGKSFVALDMAAHIGGGLDWNGCRVAQGEVIYLAAEGAYGMKKRVRAWESEHGRAMRGIYIFPEALQVTKREWLVFIELIRKRKPALVVLDTQARITVSLDENSATDMGMFVEKIEQLRAASGISCVMPVHHLGHQGKEGRGSTAVIGAMTTEIRVERSEEENRVITVECVKQKNAEDGMQLAFELKSIELPPDADGLPVTSAVIQPTEAINLPTLLANWEADVRKQSRGKPRIDPQAS